jgi:predicted dehydrogenase
MLKVAIIGCGKIADVHASQVLRLPGVEIVGVCDREPLMAQQLYDRFPIKAHFSDVSELLEKARPDIVHITTPPSSHFSLAKMCLEFGAHVYVEKPFTLDAHEAEWLLELATTKNLNLTVGHDEQFCHAARRLRSLVSNGYLGAGAVHMESYYCYELGGAYVEALLGDKQHWVRRLPGKLLHNIISHGIARVAEFLSSESPLVIAHGFTSPYLRNLGETELIDELRVIISGQESTTAYFTFSSQMRPSLHQFRIYGSKNGLVLDQDQETLIKLRGSKYKSYAEKFVPPANFAKQYLGNLKHNLGAFSRNDFHMKSGMKCLTELFYQSIEQGGPAPIPYREILLTARIMDEIFTQLHKKGAGPAYPIAMHSVMGD